MERKLGHVTLATNRTNILHSLYGLKWCKFKHVNMYCKGRRLSRVVARALRHFFNISRGMPFVHKLYGRGACDSDRNMQKMLCKIPPGYLFNRHDSLIWSNAQESGGRRGKARHTNWK